jgi:hypothetical protein
MALIKCEDCGKEISDKAKSCPNCGCPIAQEPAKSAPVKANVAEKKVPPVKNDGNKKAPPVVVAEKKKASPGKIIGGIVGGIVGVAVLVLLVIFVILPLGSSLLAYISNAASNVETEVYTEQPTETEEYVENTVSYDPNHVHYYYGSVTKKATCNAEGVETFTCECGANYTQPINRTSHSWQSATCTKPKRCEICGETSGSAKGHNYYSDGECASCGQMDPQVNSTLSKCKLIMPTVPQTINYYDYSGDLESTVKVTGITYQFVYEGDGKVSLTATFSGKKTYDSRGPGQSDSAKIGWKIYDPKGNVLNTGTFYSPSVAEGESFANQEEDLIYNFQATEPGTYRLELINVN